jgi:UDP-N-acetylglucosamine transferase subunit ALG13
VLMPGREKNREHVDDQQAGLAKALAEEGKVVPVFEPVDLPEEITQARLLSAKAHAAQPRLMLDTVRKAIQDLTGQ